MSTLRFSSARLLLVGSLLAGLLLSVPARTALGVAILTKADTATMNGDTDWDVPFPSFESYSFLFGSTLSATNAAQLELGGNLSPDGLVFGNNLNGPVTISDTFGFGANTLTLGPNGIDMSAANKDVAINCGVVLGIDQAFNIGSGCNLAIGGVVSTSGGTPFNLTKSGDGTLTFSGVIAGTTSLTITGGVTTLSSDNTFSGDTTLTAGTLQLDNNLALRNSALAPNGGTLVMSSGVNTPTFGGLTGATNLTLPSNVTGLTLNPGTGITKSYSGTLGGGTAMSLTKTGGGTQIFAGDNTYTGLTTVKGGLLRYSASQTAMGKIEINDGTVTIDDGVSLAVKGGTSTIPSITFSASNSINKTGTTGTITNGGVDGDANAPSFNVSVGSGITGTINADMIFTGNRDGSPGWVMGGGGNLTLTGQCKSKDGNQKNNMYWDGGGALTIAAGGLLSNLYTGGNAQTDKIYVGSNSANNTMNVQGRLVGNTLGIGAGSFGGNILNVTGPGTSGTPTVSLTGNNIAFIVGANSSGNSATFSLGSYFYMNKGSGGAPFEIGQNVGANLNSMTIDGGGTPGGATVNAYMEWAVGKSGSFNTLTVKAGGVATGIYRGYIGSAVGRSDNSAVITDAGSSFFFTNHSNAAFGIGIADGAARNRLIVENGASATLQGSNSSRLFWMGNGTGADDNYLRVTGVGSTLTITHVAPFAIGGTNSADSLAARNHLDVYSGATAAVRSLTLKGVNSAVNLGDGTGISQMTVGYSGSTGGIALTKTDSSVNFNRGRLVASLDGAMISGQGTVNLNGDAYVNTAGFSSSIGSVVAGTTSAGTLTKEGLGTLALSQINTYVGATNVSVGTLALSHSTASNNIPNSAKINVVGGATLNAGGLNGGKIALSSGQTLMGTGTVTGGVIAQTGSIIAPGASVGTLTVDTLTMNAGSIYNFEFNSTPSNDQINVTGMGGLTVNGGGFNLYSEGTTDPWTDGDGVVYKLIQYTGDITGSLSTLSVLNPAPGRTYQFNAIEGYVTVNIVAGGAPAPTLVLSTADGLRVLKSTIVTVNGTAAQDPVIATGSFTGSLSDNGGQMTASNFSPSGPITLAPTDSMSVSADVATGTTTGSRTYSIKLSDGTNTAIAEQSMIVLDQRTLNVGTPTIALGTIHAGAVAAGTTAISSSGLNDVTANATLGSFAGTGTGSLTLTTGDSTVFAGGVATQTANYSVGGTAAAGTLSGSFSAPVTAELGSISNVGVTVQAAVTNGIATWTASGNGTWDIHTNWTDSVGVQAAPGTFAGFDNVDMATFNGSNGPAIVTVAAPVNLASLSLSGASYTIQGSTLTVGGSVTATGTQTISAAINGTTGVTLTGPGTLLLSGANGYSGVTKVVSGVIELGVSARAAVIGSSDTGFTDVCGKADVKSGKMLFDYADRASGDLLATKIKNILKASSETGFINTNSNIYTSNTSGKALGWMDNNPTRTEMASSITVMYTLYGDATLDGTVNFDDLNKVLTSYNQPGTWATGDFTYDGNVNFDDLNKVLTAYNTSLGVGETISGAGLDGQAINMLSGSGFTVVPEPSSVVLLLAGLMGLLAYGWRKRK